MSTFITRQNRSELTSTTGQGFGVAIVFHMLIVAFFTMKVIFFPETPLSLESAIRVDIVGLPEKTQSLPTTPVEPIPQSNQPVQKTETATETPVTTPKMPEKIKHDESVNLNKAKLKQNEALEKLKKLDAIEKIKKSVEAENKNADKSAPVKGNILSPGTSLTGVNKLQHDQYRSLLNDHVKKNWTAPEWLSKKKFRAQIIVKFDESGQLLEKKVIHSSGSDEFDALALAALEKSAPLPRPPEKFVDLVRYNGVVVEFGGQ